MKDYSNKPLSFFVSQPIQIRLSTIIDKALKEASRDAESILSYLLYSGKIDTNKSRNDFYFIDLDDDHNTVVRFSGVLNTENNFLCIDVGIDTYRVALTNAYEKAKTEEDRAYIKLKLNSTYTEEHALASWIYGADVINTEKGDRRWESEEHGLDINWSAPEHAKYLSLAKDLLEIANGAVVRDLIDKVNEYRHKL